MTALVSHVRDEKKAVELQHWGITALLVELEADLSDSLGKAAGERNQPDRKRTGAKKLAWWLGGAICVLVCVLVVLTRSA